LLRALMTLRQRSSRNIRNPPRSAPEFRVIAP
jgi:hypothetical protein